MTRVAPPKVSVIMLAPGRIIAAARLAISVKENAETSIVLEKFSRVVSA